MSPVVKSDATVNFSLFFAQLFFSSLERMEHMLSSGCDACASLRGPRSSFRCKFFNFYEMLMLTLWTNKRTRHKATLLFCLLVFKFT